MRPSDLLCARCGGRVAERGCASCRLVWSDVRERADRALPWLLVGLIALLALLAVTARASLA